MARHSLTSPPPAAARRRPPAINVALAGAALAGAVLAGGGLTSTTAAAGAEYADGGAPAVVTGVGIRLGPRRYVVTDVHHYAKADLPADTFIATGRPHLVLITCGGAFNTLTRQYADNIVVDATPA